jgi:hypothetical protein
MEELELLTGMEKVQAPADFEQRVMARLALRKRRRVQRRRLSLSLATAAASLAAVILAVNFLVLPRAGSERLAGLEKTIPADFQPHDATVERIPVFPITEALDFSGEFRQVTRQPRTIYILEQVSDRTDTRIIY